MHGGRRRCWPRVSRHARASSMRRAILSIVSAYVRIASSSPFSVCRLELQLVGPDGSARRPYEVAEPADQPGAVQARETVSGVVAELAGQFAGRAWPWPLAVEQQHEDRPLDPVLVLRRGTLIAHGKAFPFRATAPGGCRRAGANYSTRVSVRRGCDGILRLARGP